MGGYHQPRLVLWYGDPHDDRRDHRVDQAEKSTPVSLRLSHVCILGAGPRHRQQRSDLLHQHVWRTVDGLVPISIQLEKSVLMNYFGFVDIDTVLPTINVHS